MIIALQRSEEIAALQVSAALIEEHGRLFIAQRPPWKRHGFHWEFPGGQVEPGESPGTCLVREIHEELNWRIRVLEPFQLVRLREPEFAIDLHVFWCERLDGRLVLRDHLNYRWAAAEELGRYRLTQADRALIPALLAWDKRSKSKREHFPTPML